MAAVRHLGFVMRVFGPPTKIFGGFYHCANVVGIDPLVSIIWKLIFAILAWKRLFTPPKWVLGDLNLNGEQWQRDLKMHLVARKRVIWRIFL